MTRFRMMLLVTAVCAVVCTRGIAAQGLAPTILDVDVENFERYVQDVADPALFSTNPNVAAPRTGDDD